MNFYIEKELNPGGSIGREVLHTALLHSGGVFPVLQRLSRLRDAKCGSSFAVSLVGDQAAIPTRWHGHCCALAMLQVVSTSLFLGAH